MRKGKIKVGGRGKRVKGKLSGGKSVAKPGKNLGAMPARHMMPGSPMMREAPMRAGKTGSKLGPEHKRRMGRLEKAAL